MNQYHICVVKDVGELFVDYRDELVLAWDTLTQQVMQWQPNVYAASVKSIVYTSHKAWLIVKPMKSALDVKFYHSDRIESDLIHRHTIFSNKFAHHIRIKHESEINSELIGLLKIGYNYSLQ